MRGKAWERKAIGNPLTPGPLRFTERNMPFSDIVGHRKQLATLRWGLEKDRLHHAYVFLGSEGVGKKTVALSLAKAIHCLEMDHDFCGSCANCVRIENRNHPDVRLLGLLARKKEISIEQIRELERGLNYRAFSGKQKVAIIDPAPLMNVSAQNALLKTLEEPPEGSVLILVSTSAGALLPTLLSRCLRLSFAPLQSRDVADYLVSQKGVKGEEAELRAAMAMGSLGRALAGDPEERVQKRRGWVRAIVSSANGDLRGNAALVEEISQDREETLKFLEWAEGWYRDILVYGATGGDEELCNIDMIENIRDRAQADSLERSFFLRGEAILTAARIRRNINRRIALERFLAHVAGLQ